MLTLYHAPRTRSTRVLQLLDELGALDRVTVETVSVSRGDGSGGPDPRNPHPEGKVPAFSHDGELVWESPAIFLYLTDLFPEAGLGPLPGQKGRGSYLSWLAWYGDVVEPVLHFHFFGIDSPDLARTFRGYDEMAARLAAALADRPWLLGERFSAADLLIGSTFILFPAATPADSRVQDWVARLAARPSGARAASRDAAGA